MPKCNPFTIAFNSSAISIVAALKEELSGFNSKLDDNSNENSGSFSVHGVTGDYTINGQQITIVITNKPLIIPVSCGRIEKEVRQKFIGL